MCEKEGHQESSASLGIWAPFPIQILNITKNKALYVKSRFKDSLAK